MGAAWEYFKTIRQHRKIVRQECKACGIGCLGWKHDLSKYSWSEFDAGAEFYKGSGKTGQGADESCRGYPLAWQHHKGHNPHHWEYWIEFGENGNVIPLKIPFVYVVEMVCDWIGAGKVYSKDKWTQQEPLIYYKKVRDRRYFHPDTENLILAFLSAIDTKGLEEFHKMARGVGPYSYLKCDYDHPGLCP